MLRGALFAALAAMLWVAPAALARWSAPAQPQGCAVAISPAVPPLVIFPASDPLTRSGPGALLWSAPRGCGARDGGTASAEVLGATLTADDLPEPARPLLEGDEGGLATITAATGTAVGQVVLSGLARPLRAPGASVQAGTGAPAAGRTVGVSAEGEAIGAFAEGRTVGAFAPARALGGPAAPVAASSAYLGDAVLASPVRARRGGWAVAVRTQRHYSSTLGSPRLVPVGPGPPTAVAAALDYRADILLVWAAGGGVYAREIAQSGALEPVRGLGAIGTGPEVRALLSDDGHAIVAWRSQTPAPGGGTRTTIELSLFETGTGAAPSPPAPLQVERFRDPPGWIPPAGTLRLIRLSSEAVMMAWTGIDAGRSVVRASPVSLRRGAWAPVIISGASARGGDAILTDLVPGPHAEALVLWSAAPRLPGPGRAGSDHWALLAARGHYAGHGEVAFEAPETVAPPGPYGPPAAAFDPGTGQALAAWVVLTGGTRPGGSRIMYALRAAGPASTPPPAGARAARGRTATAISQLAAALAALVLLPLVAAVFVVATHRPWHIRARRG